MVSRDITTNPATGAAMALQIAAAGRVERARFEVRVTELRIDCSVRGLPLREQVADMERPPCGARIEPAVPLRARSAGTGAKPSGGRAGDIRTGGSGRARLRQVTGLMPWMPIVTYREPSSRCRVPQRRACCRYAGAQPKIGRVVAQAALSYPPPTIRSGISSAR